MKPKRKSNP